MYKYRRIISILLLFATFFSCLPFAVYANVTDAEERNKLKDLFDQCATIDGDKYNQTDFYHYYYDNAEGEESWREAELCFYRLPTAYLYDTWRQTFEYDSEERALIYTDRTTHTSAENIDQYKVNFRIIVDGEVLYSGNKVVIVDDKADNICLLLEAENDFVVGKNPLDKYEDKPMEMQFYLTDKHGNVAAIDGLTDDEGLYSVSIPNGFSSSKSVNLGENQNKSLLEKIIDVINAPLDFALRLLENLFASLLLAVGDGILLLTSSAVGQKLTLEAILFGDVEKLSLNFWNNNGNGGVINTLSDTVKQWYNVFSIISIAIFLMMLLIIGIKIAYSSTGAGRAKYQVLIKDWIIGIALLFLFPYAMKIMIDFNSSLVESVGKIQTGDTVQAEKLSNVTYNSLRGMLGTNGFVKSWTGKAKLEQKDGFMYVRYLAGVQKRIPLAIVYLIMVFQLIIITFVYYKRAFMVAFLITIFPLVTIAYTLDKLRRRSNTYKGVWQLAKRVFFKRVYASFSCSNICNDCNGGARSFQSSWKLVLFSYMYNIFIPRRKNFKENI